MVVNEDLLGSFLLYNDPIRYSENITLYPVKMSEILSFNQYIYSFTIRKDSVFPIKEIIKMSYLDFLFYCTQHSELGIQFKIPYIQNLYIWAAELLGLVCQDQEIKYGTTNGWFSINGENIDAAKFDDIRRIILIQNDVDFDVDEFLHHDTEEALKKAQEFESKKRKDHATIEDYIDSLIIGLRVTEDYVKNLTIRKFWRYIKRLNKQEEYRIIRTAECGGMMTLKEPLSHWMTSLEVEDKYANLKTDEQELRSKIE